MKYALKNPGSATDSFVIYYVADGRHSPCHKGYHTDTPTPTLERPTV